MCAMIGHWRHLNAVGMPSTKNGSCRHSLRKGEVMRSDPTWPSSSNANTIRFDSTLTAPCQHRGGDAREKSIQLRTRTENLRLNKSLSAGSLIMSAFPPKADICGALAHVRFVPLADTFRETYGSAVSGMATANTTNATNAAAPSARKPALYPKWSTTMPDANPLSEAPIPCVVAIAPKAKL